MGGANGTTTCPVCGNENAFANLEYFGGGFTYYEDIGCKECGYDYERRLVNIKGEYPHTNDKGVFDEPLFYVEKARFPIGDDGKTRYPQEMETVQTAEGILTSRIKGKLKEGDIPQAVLDQEWKEAAKEDAESGELAVRDAEGTL